MHRVIVFIINIFLYALRVLESILSWVKSHLKLTLVILVLMGVCYGVYVLSTKEKNHNHKTLEHHPVSIENSIKHQDTIVLPTTKKISTKDYIDSSNEIAKEYAKEINSINKQNQSDKKEVIQASPKQESLRELYFNDSRTREVKPSNFVKIISFDPNDRPIIKFAPLQTGMINLQKGERVVNISFGDTSRWNITQSYVGDKKNGHVIILIKPTTPNIVTNLIIITNKRVYNFNILSRSDVFTPDVRFLYPTDATQSFISTGKPMIDTSTQTPMHYAQSNTVINASKLRSNYTLTGDNPTWKPVRIFDDGIHTMIAFSPMTGRTNLPVLYVYINGQPSMVNYRYHRPYMIVDRLFQHAELISGKGDNQQAIQIFNHNT
jgi:type IV secretion system protein TrbG